MEQEALTPNEVLNLSLYIGEQMLSSNAEINRVEDTVIRICKAYIKCNIDIFSIKSLIIVTLRTEDNEVVTQTRRIYSSGTNLWKLEDLNAVSRYVCRNKPSREEIKSLIESIRKPEKKTSYRVCLGYILSSSAFCIFFGGKLIDAVVCALIAIIIYYIDMYLKGFVINQFIYTILCSIVAGYSAILFVKAGFLIHIDKVMIGDIMLLIPGISMVSSVRDMFSGDIMAGLLRLSETILLSSAIALGFAIPLISVGGIV